MIILALIAPVVLLVGILVFMPVILEILVVVVFLCLLAVVLTCLVSASKYMWERHTAGRACRARIAQARRQDGLTRTVASSGEYRVYRAGSWVS